MLPRWLISTITGAAAMRVTDLYNVMRAQLARTFIEHKADLRVPTASDPGVQAL
jgi:hypothetical protein